VTDARCHEGPRNRSKSRDGAEAGDLNRYRDAICPAGSARQSIVGLFADVAHPKVGAVVNRGAWSGRRPRLRRLGRLALRPAAWAYHNEPMTHISTTPASADSAIQSRSPNEVSLSEHPPGPQASDLARRVAHRRNELGLSIEELATRAGADPHYLRYFEHSPDATLSAGTMLLIANVLETSPVTLLGGEVDRPPGHGRAGRHPVLETLTQEQCEAHLSVGGVGRILFVTGRGPVAVPVNFEFTNGEVVFSTDETKAKDIETEHFVGFEVDRVDEAVSEGWSVLVTGRGRRIKADAEEYQRLASLDLEAWAGGTRHTLVAITADQVTGRVIVHESPPEQD
jgi:nitroimidazol reductase NimA-like FMN-containing flavoprotein (pyridoxamine 5'-phosphate oxidase superfamily)